MTVWRPYKAVFCFTPRGFVGAVLLIIGLASAQIAKAQVDAQQAPPPTVVTADNNGVDLMRGAFNFSKSLIAIGNPKSGGMTYTRSYVGAGWRDNFMTGIASGTASDVFVTFGGVSDHFNIVGGLFTPAEGQDSTLVAGTGNQLIYTSANGVVVVFAPTTGGSGYAANYGRAVTATFPTGEVQTYTYNTASATECLGDTCPPQKLTTITKTRLQSVVSNRGYMAHFDYGDDSNPSADFNTLQMLWMKIAKVTLFNLAVDYCAPSANTCTFSQVWPSVSYVRTTTTTTDTAETDELGRVTHYTGNDAVFLNALTAIQRPSSSAANVSIVYNPTTFRVSSLTRDGQTWNYSYADAANIRTTTVTNPLSGQRVVTSDLTLGRVLTDRDPLLRTVSYGYDTLGRVTSITSPEGDIVQYAYDARGNISQTTKIAKPGSGLANLVNTANYDTTCVSRAKCNKPNWTRDALLNQTDYVYDATTGVTISVTAPAATNGVRPQTRLGYITQQAYYKNATGTVVASGQPITLLSTTSSCRTTSSCAGTADETKTTITYGAAGVANNLLPTQATQAAGDNSLSATSSLSYDSIGNVISGTDALGAVSRAFYDVARQTLQVVSPDPDGTGPLKNRSVKYAYNLDGQTTTVSQGTSNADGTGFVTLAQAVTSYDTSARQATTSSVVGGTTTTLTQYSYDALSRVTCTAQRMNPATFATLPASACTLATAGSFGNDRIAQNVYDVASRVTSTVTGLGTPEARTITTQSYNPNGTVHTVADGNGNLTTYVYDGFDRLSQTQYPTASNGTVSNTADYEGQSYDAGSRLASVRRRSGESITFAYDNLNRVTTKTVPAGGDSTINYAYDTVGHTVSALGAATSTGFTASYDALGRNTATTNYGQTLSYGYDLAGRRTKLTYPDGLFINYDYNALGELTKIRENGATSGIGVLASYGYDDWGRTSFAARGNGTSSTVGYDTAARLASIGHAITGAAVNYTFGGYSPANQIGSRSRDNDAYAWPGNVNVDRPYTPNGLNQFTAAGAASFGYDSKGNLASDGSNSYSYDVENRLLSATGTNPGTLAYDTLGRLRTTSGGASGTTNYLYDGGALVAEYGPNTTLLRRYVHADAGDTPIVWYEGAGTTDRRWLHRDERGSIIAVTNAAGGLMQANSYDEYGIPAPSNLGRFGYTGQIRLYDQGLSYYKARVYSPTMGRFLQTDPIGYGDGPNWYNYVGSDPVNRTDPDGLADDTIVVLANPLVKKQNETPPIDITLPPLNHSPWLGLPLGSPLPFADPETIVVTAKKPEKQKPFPPIVPAPFVMKVPELPKESEPAPTPRKVSPSSPGMICNPYGCVPTKKGVPVLLTKDQIGCLLSMASTAASFYSPAAGKAVDSTVKGLGFLGIAFSCF